MEVRSWPTFFFKNPSGTNINGSTKKWHIFRKNEVWENFSMSAKVFEVGVWKQLQKCQCGIFSSTWRVNSLIFGKNEVAQLLFQNFTNFLLSYVYSRITVILREKRDLGQIEVVVEVSVVTIAKKLHIGPKKNAYLEKWLKVSSFGG